VAGKSTGFWMLQGSGWLLCAYLVCAQGIPAIDYELGVKMGTQESADQITAVGTAFWYGFAFADAVVYIPLLAVGLIGLWRTNSWGAVLTGAALGITVYWPLVVLAAAVKARNAPGWHLDDSGYWIVLPLLSLWALWGLWWLVARRASV
jgi:hypothetical protein